MTTLVRGPIKLVTDRPDTVRKVNLRAPELRLHGAGIVTDHNDDIPVVNGQVEFEALPGPAVLTLVAAGGAPLRSVDIVVPDEDTATLAKCLDQIYTYDPPVVGRAQRFAREAGEHADRAQTQAGIATEQAGVAAGHAEQAGEDRVQTGADRRQTGEDRTATGGHLAEVERLHGETEQARDDAQAAAATQYAGDGFPEGKVTAPVGSIYTDTLATAGAVRWIKTSGTGNTGWQVEWGDTGRRAVNTTDPDVTVVFNRVGKVVACTASVSTFQGSGTITVTTIPEGLRPVGTERLAYGERSGVYPDKLLIAREGSGGLLQTYSKEEGTGLYISVMWLTEQPWPLTLPGTPG